MNKKSLSPLLLLAFAASVGAGCTIQVFASRIPSEATGTAVVVVTMVALGLIAALWGYGSVGAAAAGTWLGTFIGGTTLPAPSDDAPSFADPIVLAVLAGTYLVLFAVPVLMSGWTARRLRNRGGRSKSALGREA